MKVTQGNTFILPAHGLKEAVAIPETPAGSFYDRTVFDQQTAVEIDKPTQAIFLNFEDSGFTSTGNGQSAYQKRTAVI